jgi:hypothetical protein
MADEMSGIVVEHPESRLEILLRKAQQGNHDAFADIVGAHESMVFSIGPHALRDRVVGRGAGSGGPYGGVDPGATTTFCTSASGSSPTCRNSSAWR